MGIAPSASVAPRSTEVVNYGTEWNTLRRIQRCWERSSEQDLEYGVSLVSRREERGDAEDSIGEG